jgi:two-component system sensor histidine kinase KdpD
VSESIGSETARRGRLRVYLGAAPGVGKTWSMLNAGRRRKARGEDVVVGFVESHGRTKTEEQIAELEVVPRQTLEYRGAAFEEMDVDAVLARRPHLALVDELAHTNVPGCANEKRWEDIELLLDAGINVFTTVNIQHLVSLNDVVEQITGVVQRETVPDEVVRRADQLQLVDLSPGTIRSRLARGDIYPAERIDAALGNYFRLGNLAALRELALLWIADRVEEELAEYRRRHGISQPWETRERVMVALDGSAAGDRLIRRAARMAQRVGGDLVAVHVNPEDGLVGDRDALEHQRRLLEQLGGVLHETVGSDVGKALVETAGTLEVTQLVIGATHDSWWRRLVFGSTASRTLRAADSGLDVHVISHDPDEAAGERRLPKPPPLRGVPPRRMTIGFAIAGLGLAALTAILHVSREAIDLPAALLLYLLLIVIVAAVGGLWPAVSAAIAGFLLANYFFTPPFYTFDIAGVENGVALVVFVAVAVMVSVFVSLATRRATEGARLQLEAAELSRLAGSSSIGTVLDSLRRVFSLEGVALLERDGAGWRRTAGKGAAPETPEQATITAAVDARHVLALKGLRGASIEDQRILRAYTKELAASIEMEDLESAASRADELDAANDLRTAVLSAVSHDLRTPLAAIKASSSSLLQEDVQLAPEAQRELIETIDEEADRLNSLVGNLLDMSRVQTGALEVHLRPVDLDEVVPAALAGLGSRGRDVHLDLSEDLPRVLADPGLLERTLANVIANAVSYTPDDLPAHVVAGKVGDRVDVRVVDRGPGVPPEDRDRMFLPFQRLGDSSRREGVGLGLAVARGFVEAMGGSIEVEDTPGGGLTVVVRLRMAG